MCWRRMNGFDFQRLIYSAWILLLALHSCLIMSYHLESGCFFASMSSFLLHAVLRVSCFFAWNAALSYYSDSSCFFASDSLFLLHAFWRVKLFFCSKYCSGTYCFKFAATSLFSVILLFGSFLEARSCFKKTGLTENRLPGGHFSYAVFLLYLAATQILQKDEFCCNFAVNQLNVDWIDFVCALWMRRDKQEMTEV